MPAGPSRADKQLVCEAKKRPNWEAEIAMGRRAARPTKFPFDERKITDKDFFNAMDLNGHGLGAVRRAVRAGDLSAARRATVAYFRRRRRPRWFFDLRGATRDQVREVFGAGCRQHLECARAMLKNRLLLGPEITVNLGRRLNWHQRELQEHNSTSLRFKRMPYLRSLGVAYLTTGRKNFIEKYVEVLDRYLREWPLVWENRGPGAYIVQNNPVQEAMSTAVRAMLWIELLYTDVSYDPLVPIDLTFRMIRSIWFTAWQYRRFDTDGFGPYNHHLFERGTMPFQFALMLPEFPAIRPLLARGRKVTAEHLARDFSPDGGYGEHSMAYAASATLVGMYARTMTLGQLNGKRLLGKAPEGRLRRAFEATAGLAMPQGVMPDIGDGGGSPAGPILRTGEDVLKSRTCAAVRRALKLERGRTKSRDLPPLSIHFKGGGYVAGRDAWRTDANYFIMSSNSWTRSGHAHHYMLSLILSIGGETMIGEPAAKIYTVTNTGRYKGTALRGHLYNMTSHNTVLANAKPIREDRYFARDWGTFPLPVEVQAFEPGKRSLYVRAAHNGYGYCRHQREVLFAHGAGWLVADRILGAAPVKPAHIQRWHFEGGVEVTRLDRRALLAVRGRSRLLCVWPDVKGALLKLVRDQIFKADPRWQGRRFPWIADAGFSEGARLLPVLFIAVRKRPNKNLVTQARSLLDGVIKSGLDIDRVSRGLRSLARRAK